MVDDQYGRPTFARDIAAAARHLLDVGAEPGIYNLTSSGEPTTWAEIAAEVFVACGRDRADVVPTTTEEYAAGRPLAPRPRHSTLSLEKITGTGFEPTPWRQGLARYLADAEVGQ